MREKPLPLVQYQPAQAVKVHSQQSHVFGLLAPYRGVHDYIMLAVSANEFAGN